jgi:hypothetical protein
MRTRDRELAPSSSSGRHLASLIGVALLAGWAAVPVGCGDDEVCTPGAQVSCACGGGQEGAQSCNADGTALGECDCSNPSGPGSGAAGPGSGGSGPGSGGAGAGAPGSGGTGASTSSANAGGQGAGGFPACDGKGACEDSDQDDTNDCAACVLPGECKAAVDACGASAACAQYLFCIDQCGQTTDCITQCDAQVPEGVALFTALTDCICGACTNDCAAHYYCQ